VDQAVRLLKRGAVDYLLKPFEPDLLLARLKELVSCHTRGRAEANVLGVSPPCALWKTCCRGWRRARLRC